MKYKLIFIGVITVLLFSCSNDEEKSVDIQEAIELSDEVEVYDADELENSLVLAVKNGGKSAFLLDKEGNNLKQWEFSNSLGNDLELLDDGKLLGIFKPTEELEFSFGGYGGIVRIINIDGTIDWQYNYYSSTYLAHHDVELLPNGNVLILAWDRIPHNEALSIGIDSVGDVYPEALIEVNPKTDNIVWEWHAKDHFVQDMDSTKPHFGEVAANPQRINPNYVSIQNGDIMHANGIDYDPEKDVIFLSVNFYSEVWVIDHSTTTNQAAASTGGNYNKGGDLIYRFGNPEAYNNLNGVRLFNNNHFPNFLQSDEVGAGHVLVFNNGSDVGQSTVYELEMPNVYNLFVNQNNEPSIVWSFTDPNLFNQRISGAVRLKNGNTLICEGDYGFWEVTSDNRIVWKYNGAVSFWRAYNYLKSDSAILNLGI